MISCADTAVMALHDCDILTYQREMLARLCYPVAHPVLGAERVGPDRPRRDIDGFSRPRVEQAAETEDLNGAVLECLIR